MYPGTWAASTPDKPAYVMAGSGEVVTYAQLEARSNRLAHLWRERGLADGDHVAVVMENHPRFLEVAWAALRSGLVITPLNWHLTPNEMRHVLGDCQARSVVTTPALAPTVATMLDLPLLRTAFVVDDAAAGFERYEDAVADQPTGPVSHERRGVDMIYSSGTTGKPKGGLARIPDVHPAELPRRYVQLYETFGLGQHCTYLSPGAPMYHASPLRFCVATTSLGGTAIVQEAFDPEAALRSIDAHQVTHSQWVPTMFTRLLRLPEEVRAGYVGATHEVALHAAAPCPRPVKEAMLDWWGPIVTEFYGGSEGGAITVLRAEDWAAHRGSVGRPVIGEVHITDDDGEEVPPRTPGLVRFGRGAPIQYFNDPGKTAAAHDRNGWSTLGDVGYLDEDGFLYLTDRKDFMIIAGGVNIYPQEVEDVLVAHPAVADVAVIGVPNEEWGEEVKAVVELLDPASRSEELVADLLEHCRAHLASYKCPRSIDFDDELPRSPAGKLYKRHLRDRYWEGHATRVV